MFVHSHIVMLELRLRLRPVKRRARLAPRVRVRILKLVLHEGPSSKLALALYRLAVATNRIR